MSLLHTAGSLRAVVEDAIDNMRAVRQRTLLSLVGVAIGAAAVVALLNIGENTSDEAARQFKSMGTDLIIVQDSPSMGGRRRGPRSGVKTRWNWQAVWPGFPWPLHYRQRRSRRARAEKCSTRRPSAPRSA